MLASPAPAVVPVVLGRQRELERIDALLGHVREISAAGVVRIVAGSGYGKTALWADALRNARETGWLVLEARCYAGQQRTPGAALRRLVADGIRAFSKSKKRYVSGLEQDLTSASTIAGRFELAFTRLIEGLLVDYPTILAFDDAQWLDQQTVAMLQRLVETNPGIPLAIVTAHQVGHGVALPEVPDSLTISLRRLKRNWCEDLARELWPEGSPELISSLVDRSSGIPFDLIALTQQARADGVSTPSGVSRTARMLLQEMVAALAADQREFLQLCSLMREPIELGILRRLVDDESALESLIARSSGRFVVMDGSTLRFAHNLIAEAVRSTISSPLLLRRRIITAYVSANAPRIDDYDRIAALAAEIGDTETEYHALTTLATAAYAQDAYETVIGAFERALQLRRPDADDFVMYYNQYSMALRLVGRWADARRVLESAVFDGITRGFRGVGLLASTLLWIIRMEADSDVARSQFDEFCQTILHPSDRHDLLAMGALLAGEAADAAAFEAIESEIANLAGSPSRYATALFHMAAATMKTRLGRFPDAWAALAAARAHIDNQRSVHKYSVDCLGNSIRIREHGCAEVRLQYSWQQRRDDGSIVNQEPPLAVLFPALEIGAVADFAAGNWDAAIAKVESINPRSVGPCMARTSLLSVVAAIAVFNGQKPDLADLIEADLRYCSEGALWKRAFPLAFWWAAYIQTQEPARASALVGPILPFISRVPETTEFNFPIARVLYASRANDTDLLRRLAASQRYEQTPWERGQELFAAGIACRELRDPRAKVLLSNAHDSFDALGADFFSAYASNALGKATPRQHALLEKLGLSVTTGGEAQTRARLRQAKLAQPTLREREVAELVAEGNTNRKIAEQLTLSERTVEVHIANLFNKLNISSRTQLVRYVIQDGMTARGARDRAIQ